MATVGFIGLGTMGYPIAGHISKSYETLVFNRTIQLGSPRKLDHSIIELKFGETRSVPSGLVNELTSMFNLVNYKSSKYNKGIMMVY